MAFSKRYTLKELSISIDKSSTLTPSEEISNLAVSDGIYDIRNLAKEIAVHESLDSPSLRMDITMIDTVDFNAFLSGNELVKLNLITDSDPTGDGLNIIMRVFKIGSVVKQERTQLYTLHCVSPEVYNNEVNRVFKSFIGKESGTEAVKKIVTDNLKASKKMKGGIFEDSSGIIQFISPNWRPFDTISYISDKIVRASNKNQSGFLFFENKLGYNFVSIDYLCSSLNPTYNNPLKYSYTQKNIQQTGGGYYNIEMVKFPDKYNHLEKMRSGTYSSAILSLNVPNIFESGITDSGRKKESSKGRSATPSGTKLTPTVVSVKSIFGIANKLESQFPYPESVSNYLYDGKQGAKDTLFPARSKLRILPGLSKQSSTGNTANNGNQANRDTIAVSAYANARYQLLNTIQLTIVVPGNTSIVTGNVISVSIPKSLQSGGRVIEDPLYSGKYLVIGLTHRYSAEGVTTTLVLARDSIKRA